MCASNSNTIYQLVRAESLSIYMDHDTESALVSNRCDWDISSFLEWKDTMHKSLQTFGMRNKEFQFRKCINSSSYDILPGKLLKLTVSQS